ncbi:alpha/beta hydrolase family protein [Actinosynnema sp. NPDC059797]
MRTRAPAAVVAVLAALATAAPATATAPDPVARDSTGARVAIPAPTGRHPVGTVELHLVDDRPDPWRPGEAREVMVTVSYPAERSHAPRAPWMTPGVAAGVDRLASTYFGTPPGAVDWAAPRRHARTGAAPARGRWPVVLFSPGFGSVRELHVGVTDDLASRGYVVVSMSHTHESVAVEFPGGRVEPPLADVEDVGDRRTAIDARVADTRFVLDELARLDYADLSRVGAFGHSYGGYAAGEAMVHDRRIDAGVNLDGAMAHSFGGSDYRPGEVVTRGLDRPFMLVGGELVDGDTGARLPHSHRERSIDPTWADFWPNQRGWKRDLFFERSSHYSFTDLQFAVPQLDPLFSPEQRAAIVGEIDPERSLGAQRDYLAAYFDLHLKGRHTHLFRGDSPRYPDVRFIR